MKDKAINDAMDSIKNRVSHVYNQGYNDGVKLGASIRSDFFKTGYEKGLEEAWECARKILFDGSLSRDILTELGTDSFSGVIHKCSASEAIAKLKEYEEKQTEEKTDKSNLCADCETCRFADLTAYEFPCSCCSKAYGLRWQLKDKEGDS